MTLRSTFTSLEQWREDDLFELELYSPLNPLERDRAGLEEMLDVVESVPGELMPDRMRLTKRTLKYSRVGIREQLHEVTIGRTVSIKLKRSRAPNAWFNLNIFEGNENARFCLDFKIDPFSFWQRREGPEACAQGLLELVRAFTSRFPLSYGWAHSDTDFYLGDTPFRTSAKAPPGVYEAYWLNVYGASLVEQLGRSRVLATPAAHMEELPGGAVLWLTRPTPTDFDSEEARQAQARALMHLRPELKREEVLATLRERSRVFVPEPLRFHPGVEPILREKVGYCSLSERRKLVEQYNAYQPPPVTEWLPLEHQPPSDMDSEEQAQTLRFYELGLSAQLAAQLRKQVPEVMERSPRSLARVDYYLWTQQWVKTSTEKDRATLLLMLGAYLGGVLVRELGGHWVPRKAIEESAVVVGSRAWLPFLRLRHYLRDVHAPLDCSLSHFFHEAQQHRG